MSYHCGISPAFARLTGIEAGDPRIVCDGCGLVWRVSMDRPPPSWFLDGKPPRGWRQVRDGDIRHDYCPRCKTREGT